MNGPLGKYCRRHIDPQHPQWYSQHGEYGVLEFLLERLGINKGWCCEAGAGDGRENSNTLQLIERGWDAVYIEPHAVHGQSLMALRDKYPNLHIWQQFLATNSKLTHPHISHLDDTLDESGAPYSIDVLSLDVEGGEFDILDGMKTHRARIVVIEINSSALDNHRRGVISGESLGYTCLGHCGNQIFIAQEDFDKLGIPHEAVADTDSLYTPDNKDW